MLHPRLLALVLFAGTAFAQDANYKLVLEENFDGNKLDSEIWEVRSGAKQRGSFTDEAVELKDGLLTITTWTDNKVDFSGSIKMRKAKYFDFRQGKVEGRLRFNPTKGVTAVFGNDTDEDATKEKQVKIDIFVSFGYEKGGAYMTGVTWNTPGKPAEKKELNQRNLTSVGKFWHTYGVEWDSAGYRFTMDGKLRMTVKSSDGIDARRGIELASPLAAGESAASRVGYGSKEKSKAIYEVDWVKAWKYVPPTK